MIIQELIFKNITTDYGTLCRVQIMFWQLLFSLFLSVLCDSISKILIHEFDAVNISVFRAFFSGIIIIPVIFLTKVKYNYIVNYIDTA